MQKPLSTKLRPEITRLPRLTTTRKALRIFFRWISKIAIRLCTRAEVNGLENFPRRGPALVVVNHLGDADIILGLAYVPSGIDALAKMEMYDFPIVGTMMDSYGVIWVHRGQPDRRALRAALQGFHEGRFIGIAPEGRESLTGSLEEGTGGAAYLALRANVPIVPITFTGTENARIYGNLKRLRRTDVSLQVGRPFQLEPVDDQRQAIEMGTETIMRKLAEQLPDGYRGVYLIREVENDGERGQAEKYGEEQL